MDWFSEVLNAILASGIIGVLIFYNSKKRKQKAEADISEFEALKMQIKHLGEQLQEAYEETDKMQKIIDRQREKNVELSKMLSECRIRIIQEEEKKLFAEFNLCIVRNCNKRQPSRNNNNEQGSEK